MNSVSTWTKRGFTPTDEDYCIAETGVFNRELWRGRGRSPLRDPRHAKQSVAAGVVGFGFWNTFTERNRPQARSARVSQQDLMLSGYFCGIVEFE